MISKEEERQARDKKATEPVVHYIGRAATEELRRAQEDLRRIEETRGQIAERLMALLRAFELDPAKNYNLDYTVGTATEI